MQLQSKLSAKRQSENIQERQCTSNVTLRRVHETTNAVEKQ
jgi:hypothetical protein